MMNTVRVELTNSISPNLSWKVSKGYRSAPRRRKPVDKCLKLGVEPAIKSTKISSETTVSESEKLGVAVLGRRFSDKIEHVPIKKRRLMVRSPSPPPHLSSQLPGDNQPGLDHRRASYQKSCSKSNAKKDVTKSDTSSVTSLTHSAVTLNESLTEPANEKPGYGEDFSGIEILAAAACNNSIHDDVGEELSREGTNSSTSARPLEKIVVSFSSTITDSEISEGRDASAEAIHYSPKDAVHEDKLGNSSLEDSMVKTNTGDGDDPAVASSKDVRFHWDLNVCMDAWGEPCDPVMVDPQANTLDNISIDRQTEKQPVSHDVDVHGSIAAKNQKMLPVFEDMEQGLKASPDLEISYRKCGVADNALGSSKDAGVVTNNSDLVVSMDGCGDITCVPSDNVVGTSPLPLEKNGTQSTRFGEQLGENVHSGNMQVETPAITCVPNVEGVSCEMGSTVVDDDGKGSGATSSSHDDPKSPEDMTPVESCHLQKSFPEDKPVGKTEDLIKPASYASAGEGPSLVNLIAKDQVEAASQTFTVNSQQNAGFLEGTAKSSRGAAKATAAEACPSHEQCHYGNGTRGSRVTTVDSYGVNSNLNDKDHMVANKPPLEQEVGYDSQYEDGELRESDVPYWEENEFDEVEHVDYGSDTCDTDAADGSVSGKVEGSEFCGIESRNSNMNVQVVRGLSLGSDNICGKVEHSVTGNALGQSSVGSKTRTSGSEQLPGDSEASSNRTAEATEGCTIRKHTGDSFYDLDGKDPAKVDGPLTSDTLNRMGTSCRRRYGNFDFSTRSGEVASDYSLGKERSDSRMLGKSLGGVRLVNPSRSCWDSKRHGSPPYRGSFGSDRPRPRSGIESDEYAMDPDDTFSDAAEVAGVHSRVRRPAMSYNSNRSYQPTFRRRSPDTHRGMIPMRDISPDRRRLRRYPLGAGRGIRDYHRPIPEELNDSSFNGPRRITRREPSASPPGRGPYYGRPRFQSRGRSRSPLAWERNEVSRHCGSRSPDYRFDGKLERGRAPFQKNSFGPKYEPRFISPPKRRFSPQHHARWFDDHNGAGDHNFRGRRGGGRRFQPGPRFDSVCSRRVDSDDYFEPNVRPRFSELNSGGRECRFEGSDEDRRKPERRFEIIQRVRRYDTDGVVRQFRYDGEDRFASRNAQDCNTQNLDNCDNNRGADRRPRDVYLGEPQQQQQIEKRRGN
ncbi:uncharacterized protein LOC126801652 [Argentina anserina]|uniref:uncharacterized protein LOC126801652 n=1 Tax=Argentina anserina TaxID=57926 RepID=UPI002176388A|nr:uncharacterized protein LOC126801652 [Potentilla anserina]XP_050385031.1 uncharacterized protein LOC126801652 [Potentilla anserina]